MVINAWVAELADALDLGSSTERCEGSTPSSRTCFNLSSCRLTIVAQVGHIFWLPESLALKYWKRYSE